MKTKITVIDYGLGNLLSIRQAFEHCGAEVELSDSPDAISNARGVILPGVGAFEDGMAGLRAKYLIDPIKKYAASGKPLLGICLGMQMLFDSSDEFGSHAGLGLIGGKVSAIPATKSDGSPHKVPHIGWNALKPVVSAWENTILDSIEPQSCVYFVHSFTGFPVSEAHRLADCDYNGRRISAVVNAGNIWGCQFHPEKSGKTGLRIVENFIRLAAK